MQKVYVKKACWTGGLGSIFESIEKKIVVLVLDGRLKVFDVEDCSIICDIDVADKDNYPEFIYDIEINYISNTGLSGDITIYFREPFNYFSIESENRLDLSLKSRTLFKEDHYVPKYGYSRDDLNLFILKKTIHPNFYIRFTDSNDELINGNSKVEYSPYNHSVSLYVFHSITDPCITKLVYHLHSVPRDYSYILLTKTNRDDIVRILTTIPELTGNYIYTKRHDCTDYSDFVFQLLEDYKKELNKDEEVK